MTLTSEQAAVGDELFKVGNGQCMKRGWLLNDKKAGLIKRKVESVVDETRAALQAIAGGSEEGVAELKKRKMVTEQCVSLAHYVAACARDGPLSAPLRDWMTATMKLPCLPNSLDAF